MSWGISSKASQKEKIKAEFNDYIKGLNSTGIIDYQTYSDLYDFTMPLFDKMYNLDREGKEPIASSKNS